MKKTADKLLTSYDELDVINGEYEYVKENPEEAKEMAYENLFESLREKHNLSEEELFEKIKADEFEEEIIDYIFQDSGLFEMHVEGFKESINEILKEKGAESDYIWDINASNLGWRNRSGSAVKEIEDWEGLQEILPDTDMTIRVYDESDGFRMIVYHHDSPTGEIYYFFPAESEYKEGDKVRGEFPDGTEFQGTIYDVYFDGDDWTYDVNYTFEDYEGDTVEESGLFTAEYLEVVESADKTSKKKTSSFSGEYLEQDAGMRNTYADLLVELMGCEWVLDGLVRALSDDEAVSAFDYMVRVGDLEEDLKLMLGPEWESKNSKKAKLSKKQKTADTAGAGNNLFSVEENSKGDLVISATEQGIDYLQDEWNENTKRLDVDIYDILEISGALGNGFTMVPPEMVGALTDSPIIGWDIPIGDDDMLEVDDDSKLWWYPDYQVTDPVLDLYVNGEVVFTKE